MIGPTRLDVIDHFLHLLVGQVAEARGDDHQVGRAQCFEAGNVVGSLRVDRPVGADGEQDRALEPMALRQDLGQLRQPFLGAVLFVTAHQHDVLSLRRTIGTLVDNPRVTGDCPGGRRQQNQHAQCNSLCESLADAPLSLSNLEHGVAFLFSNG